MELSWDFITMIFYGFKMVFDQEKCLQCLHIAYEDEAPSHAECSGPCAIKSQPTSQPSHAIVFS